MQAHWQRKGGHGQGDYGGPGESVRGKDARAVVAVDPGALVGATRPAADCNDAPVVLLVRGADRTSQTDRTGGVGFPWAWTGAANQQADAAASDAVGTVFIGHRTLSLASHNMAVIGLGCQPAAQKCQRPYEFIFRRRGLLRLEGVFNRVA